MIDAHTPKTGTPPPALRRKPVPWLRPIRSWRAGPDVAHSQWRQLLLPVALAVLQVVPALGAEHHDRGADLHVDTLGWVLLLVGPAALVARRRWPVPVLWVAFVAATLPSAPRFAYLSVIAALVLVVAGGRRRAAAVLIVVGYAASLWLIPLARGQATATLDQALLIGGWLAVLAVVGEVARARRDHAAVARAARQAEEGRRLSDERLRMARDLHDIIGHNIALISVQAGTGLDLFDDDPDQARQSLTAIRTVAREALDELRTVLATLRHDGDEPPHAPTPGVDRLPDLIAASRAAGLVVTLQTDGAITALPAAVDLAAYRIVQESLTNVARHAGPAATATIRLDYRADRLLVRVHDDGAPAAAGHGPEVAGSGIAGMRERAAALGGQLHAGPDPAGGFAVVAELPLHGGRP